jgi:nucleoside 2-deoxyribosyltransferase
MGGNATGVAYVICPIGPPQSDIRARSDEIFDHIIAPVVKALHLVPDRSDKDASPGSITAAIVRSILDARVVIADLTGHNPNVFYELGVAHSFGKPVVMLNDSTEHQPFDVHNERAIALGAPVRITLTDATRVKKQLRATLNIVLSKGHEPASVVSDVARKRQLAQLESKDPRASQIDSLVSQFETLASRLRSLERGALITGSGGGPIGLLSSSSIYGTPITGYNASAPLFGAGRDEINRAGIFSINAGPIRGVENFLLPSLEETKTSDVGIAFSGGSPKPKDRSPKSK